MNRRKFTISTSLLLLAPTMNNAIVNISTVSRKKEAWNTISDVYKIIFPNSKKYNLEKYNPSSFLFDYSNSKYFPKSTLNYIIKGSSWINEDAQQVYKNDFSFLTTKEQQIICDKLSKTRWGKSWLSHLINYAIVGLLSDPIYGGNNDKIGWKFIDHNTGFPHPKKRYGEK